ncbi:MAG: DNA mismatch repair protein MutS [Candidatus Gastranaerophilales bacterium]|nr:DNA mismatch repair protein MutS [Candidatus Gastranaerophilales bacterium]
MSNKEINNINSIDVDINEATPMLRQFLEIKKQNPGVILMYRMGDFYEAFFEDAITISQDLEITLTARDGGALGKIPMAGVPAKAIDNYIPKLLDKGHKISICEQLEDPAAAKGLVKRGITRTITAGTLVEDNLLKANANNYLAALICDGDIFGLAYTDISTGEFKVTQGVLPDILAELARINPSEILAPVKKQKVLPFQIVPDEKIDLPEEITLPYNCSKVSYSAFDELKAESNIKQVFNTVTLDAFGFKEYKLGFQAAGAVIEYLVDTQKGNLPKFDIITSYSLSDFVSIDANTRRNLELLETTRDKSKFGSLLWAIDKVKTNMGSRLLKKWLTQPVKNIAEIINRQNAVEELVNFSQARLELSNLLTKVYDIERLAVRLSNNNANPRDFLAIKDTLNLLPDFEDILSKFSSEYLDNITSSKDELLEFASIIERTISENAPLALKEGGIIKEGVNTDLDYYKSLLTGGEKWLKEFEAIEKEQSGIKNLRVGYSKTFGYFIEITNSNLSLVPQNYIRRQTLTNAERFITDELKNHEADVLSAQYKITELEYKIFSDMREYSKEYVEKIKDVAHSLSRIDVLLSFANVAIESNYVKPEIVDNNELYIKEGRHPVVEKILPMGKYVANDLQLTANSLGADTQFMILTGPNMAGKSTYMRQNALIVVLAQIGCFVPAAFARIGIVDKIFTRVGAVDDLSLGQSTFMVEMSETAYILNSATEKSLILLDEIGRGTSTYDGVAIAWSVAEYIATKIKARTIFATHYHELNVMPNSIEQIKNYRITISEQEGEIEFLRKVVPGSASKSYGIQVAKMAGLPSAVVSKAQNLMTKMQKDFSKDLSSRNKSRSLEPQVPQLTLSFDK